MDKREFLQKFHHARQIIPVSDYPLKHAGKPAAVLLPIIEHDQQLTMLFTLRAKHLKHHAGQVSFPGGKQEDFDKNLLATALRETQFFKASKFWSHVRSCVSREWQDKQVHGTENNEP